MPPLTDVPDRVQNHPIYLYLFLLVAIATALVFVVKKFREALGPVGEWISARQERAAERKRKQLIAQGHLDDVRLKAAEERIEFLEHELQEERAEKQQYSDEARLLSRQLADVQRQLDTLTDEVKALRQRLEPNRSSEG